VNSLCGIVKAVCVVLDSTLVEGFIYFGDCSATAAFYNYQDISFELLLLFRKHSNSGWDPGNLS
jgi:hypothetical protein